MKTFNSCFGDFFLSNLDLSAAKITLIPKKCFLRIKQQQFTRLVHFIPAKG